MDEALKVLDEADVGGEAGGPFIKADAELLLAGSHEGALLPFVHGALVEGEQYAFAVDLSGGQPAGGEAEVGHLDADVVLAEGVLSLQVGGDRFDPGEADLDADLAELVGEHDPLDAGGQLAGAGAQAADEEDLRGVRSVARGFERGCEELAVLGGSDRLTGEHAALVAGADRGQYVAVAPVAEGVGDFLDLAEGGQEGGGGAGEHVPDLGDGVATFPGVRFYLLHSLSHLLITAISLECGYAASAIRERIYCASHGDPRAPMAAILLSTGTPGTEGTLGGLVDQGRFLRAHLRQAYDLGVLCSNDPVCAGHNPAQDPAERHLEGAACHGCLFIAECSCERFNNFLDRSLVVPTLGHDRALAFFAERP